jgi:DNA-binding NarL/FixJ family response regulator
VPVAIVEDQTFVRQVVGAFLKVFDDIKLKDEAALQLSAQNPPEIVIIDEDEFNKRVAEHEANRQRVKRIGRLLDKADSV